jgi:hypothetical protein
MKTIERSNFRVEVWPKTRVYGIKVDEEESVCKSMIDDIKRHVDNWQAVGVECDKTTVCSHCGSKWTEDGDDYNGGCCTKDQEAEDARTANAGGERTACPKGTNEHT